MALHLWARGWVACALVGATTIGIQGCSSSDNGSATGDSGVIVAPDDSGAVTHPDGAIHKDASGVGTGPDSSGVDTGSTSSAVDGTTGMLCSSNADCKSAGGPGINRCSISGYFNGGPIDPSPVCLSPDACDLGDGTSVQFCDFTDPNDPNPPGVCLPTQMGSTGLNGQCFPKCTILPDGTMPQGCQGKNACNLFAWGVDTNNQPLAIGFCVGGCAADADCPTGSKCQKDEGICLTAPKTAIKTLGQTCSANDQNAKACDAGSCYGCNCFMNQMTMLGYCSQACIVGPNSPQPCPSGYICDSQLPTQITGNNDAAVTGFTQQNVGLAGFCLQACGAGSAGDAAQACPATATCSTQDTAGADCIP